MKFIRPIDGDVLFSFADGTVEDGKLLAEVVVSAPQGQTILINGKQARENNGTYTVEIPLSSYCNTIEAVNTQTNQRQEMMIYWFRDGYRTYRFAVDDVIRTFENIWRNQESYGSIFDDPFMSIFRDLHQQYGTLIHMHIYYETDDGSFNLSMFPEKYKEEFKENEIDLLKDEERELSLLKPLCMILGIWEGIEWLANCVGYIFDGK